MAVYTHITEDELKSFLNAYDLGKLQSFEGIEKGVSNSNYHVQTDCDRYILTIFEGHRTRREDLPFLLSYAAHLAGKGISCPQAYEDKSGDIVGDLQNKPAILINYLPGTDIPPSQLTPDHCAQMGTFTARMHEAAQDFNLERDNEWGMIRWRHHADAFRDKLNSFEPGLEDFIYNTLQKLENSWPQDLPRAAVHVDLFPDNIFFDNGRLSAMIDMYFACTDYLAYDLAIVANAWCFKNGAFNTERFENLIRAYQEIRPLTDAEHHAMPLMLQGAAMRFLISRLEEYFAYDPKTTLMKPHDPREYLNKLHHWLNEQTIAA